jgi:hypothetical protein
MNAVNFATKTTVSMAERAQHAIVGVSVALCLAWRYTAVPATTPTTTSSAPVILATGI